ncbi:hypothetical protein UFOVP1639_16 [uncultured Caudovirales phage]|uniref:Uncharacterized protein n=1 Tax=uncultured Caudovirales phage TaxID=2100421 RepID=A0A6J5SXU8_9CAUD|nr:hypothetical protein UFOVP1639_16 [uncultured Caudovirales phage]
MVFNFHQNLKYNLLLERAGYVARNLPKRVAEVDRELARLDDLLSTGDSRPQDEPISASEEVETVEPKRKPTKKKA